MPHLDYNVFDNAANVNYGVDYRLSIYYAITRHETYAEIYVWGGVAMYGTGSTTLSSGYPGFKSSYSYNQSVRCDGESYTLSINPSMQNSTWKQLYAENGNTFPIRWGVIDHTFKVDGLSAYDTKTVSIGASIQCAKATNYSPGYASYDVNITIPAYSSDGSKPSLYIKNNDNNTATIYGTLGRNGSKNDLSYSTLYYTTNGVGPDGSQPYTKSVSLGSSSGADYSVTIDIPEGCSKIIAITYCVFKYNTTFEGNVVKNVTYYGYPEAPGKPVLRSPRTKPTLKDDLYFEWTKAADGSNLPVAGYRIRLFRNGNIVASLGPDGYINSDSTSTRFDFNAGNLGFAIGDKVKLGLYSYGYDGKGNAHFNDKGAANKQVFSEEYTISNAGLIRIKVNGDWKEGQVYIKVNNDWKDAVSIHVKKDGSWKESI